MSVDQNAVVAAYVADKTVTVPQVAATFGIKPAVVSAILSLHGVPVRRGNHSGSGLTPEARAKGQAVRSHKALMRQMEALVARHGAETVGAAYDAVLTTGVYEVPLAAE